ncbi:MAG: hypothetical protein LBR07_05195 [Puniceicoccales bacterium]|jgi:hypothetical protein|nr:hypothetical protein [Puniceicoccales bacterium]
MSPLLNKLDIPRPKWTPKNDAALRRALANLTDNEDFRTYLSWCEAQREEAVAASIDYIGSPELGAERLTLTGKELGKIELLDHIANMILGALINRTQRLDAAGTGPAADGVALDAPVTGGAAAH